MMAPGACCLAMGRARPLCNTSLLNSGGYSGEYAISEDNGEQEVQRPGPVKVQAQKPKRNRLARKS